jgi:Zn finger protein HypA/HybF involved in hydrogenase expression
MWSRTNETELVMHTLQELKQRDCNGHVKIKVGSAGARISRFKRIFRRFAEGTYFEDIDLQISSVPTVISCRCGYQRRLGPRSYVSGRSCPRCQGRMEVRQGDEFEILEPQ